MKQNLNKKVVICLNTSWNIYNFRLNLARAIKKAGYEVILVAPYDKYSEILKQEFWYYDIYINNKGTNPKEDLKTLIEFYKLYKKIKPDIVLNYTIKPNIYGSIACKILGIKTINNIAGLGTLFIKQNIITQIAKLLYKFSQKKATKIFFQNQDDFKMFAEDGLVQKDKCDILPGSGVDIDKFKPIGKIDDKVFRFLLVSRMLWAKGIKEFVEAAKILKSKYKNIEFQLLGQLDVQSPTAISEEQMNIWVKEGFVNYLGSSDDVRAYIRESDCIVLPSFYREGTPRILLEAASMAKPIVTTNTVGCKDVVDDGVNGFLCEVKNSQDLAKQMEKVLNLSKQELEMMGQKGREKIIREYDERIVINKYIEEINKI